jgi:hypothetical protein
MTYGEGGGTHVGRHPIAHDRRAAIRDMTALHESRILLVQRLERVVVALALTLDAEAAAEERLARMEEGAGQGINNRPAGEYAMLAQRYRDILHAIDAINDGLHADNRRTSP